MCNSIEVILSTDSEKNVLADSILKALENKIKIERTTACQKILEEKRELPLVQTDEGLVFFGIEGIKRFVKRELSLLA